ncbi:uncharacterized protein CCOS01_00204 [Colletotrichum costaricense]|uniref:Uncharacterized protein n=1 Tax=Colletotrichum costaricense TaxID=1209916 RepID=A0AAJ0E5W9_9PEZI|nr:uncharacterized protein CCOS01_00204 [Colletotrichum costaricense]KAK1538890.1 hypothetical protein CCOS01_00204 [Colletotrichum costaricense]
MGHPINTTHPSIVILNHHATNNDQHHYRCDLTADLAHLCKSPTDSVPHLHPKLTLQPASRGPHLFCMRLVKQGTPLRNHSRRPMTMS